MKKKIKDLTQEEAERLCNSRHSYSCENCPYKVVDIKLKFNNSYPENTKYQTKEDYSFCIRNLIYYMNSEIEVEENGK